MAGPMDLSPHLLPPRVYISKKVELEAEPRSKQVTLKMGERNHTDLIAMPAAFPGSFPFILGKGLSG